LALFHWDGRVGWQHPNMPSGKIKQNKRVEGEGGKKDDK